MLIVCCLFLYCLDTHVMAGHAAVVALLLLLAHHCQTAALLLLEKLLVWCTICSSVVCCHAGTELWCRLHWFLVGCVNCTWHAQCVGLYEVSSAQLRTVLRLGRHQILQCLFSWSGSESGKQLCILCRLWWWASHFEVELFWPQRRCSKPFSSYWSLVYSTVTTFDLLINIAIHLVQGLALCQPTH